MERQRYLHTLFLALERGIRLGLLRLRASGLRLEQSAFRVYAPAIAGKSAVVPDNPVTGNRYRDPVGSAGSGDGASGFRCPDPLSYLPIAGGLTSGNFHQRLPDTLLECRAAHVEREFETDPWVFDEADDSGDNFFEAAISAEQISPWKPVLELADKFFRIVSEKDGTDTLPAPRDKDRAERTLADSKFDVRIKAAVAEGGRGHAQHLIRFRIEPA